MKISVTHEVPCDKRHENECCYHDGTFMEGNTICKYHVKRTRYHRKEWGTPTYYPKCTLFDEWLEGDYQKCEACRKACENAVD